MDLCARPLEFAQRVLELSPAIVFVVDADLQVTFVNQAATNMLGYHRDEVIGRSVLDFLDTDWNPEAFRSIATALGSTGGQRQPMTFRAIAKDGALPIIEATANVQIDDPVIGGLVVYARPWTERWLLDRTLDSVAAGDPIERTMELLVEVAGADTMGADASIVFDRVDDCFVHVIASSELATVLRGPTDGLEPELLAEWGKVLVAHEGFVAGIGELPPLLRASAEPLGYRSLWAWPADLDAQGLPAVWAIAWRREPRLDADETRTGMMARLASLAGLALGRSRAEARNAYAAARDSMTGLWNRNAIYDVLSEALDDRGGSGVGVVYLDLDRFKPVNDKYGHAAGDRVLGEISQRLAAVCPAAGRVGRFGGDEFVAIGPASDLEEVERWAARLATAIEPPIELRTGETVQVGVSTGSAFAMPGEATADELIERADTRLYRVKRARAVAR